MTSKARVVSACCATVAVAVAVVLSLVVSSPALATTGYAFDGQFGGLGNGPGEFTGGFGGGPAGIAIRQSTGDVFVSDPGHTLGDGTTPDPRVERFDASGGFQSAFSIEAGYRSPGALAVDPAGSGSVYVAVTEADMVAGAVLKYSTAGVFAYALDTAGSGVVINSDAGVAVDPVSGDVFVVATNVDGGGRQVVAVFDGGSGAFIAELDGSSSPETRFGCPTSLGIDGASSLYVADPCKPRVDRYSAAGVFGEVVDDGTRGGPVFVTADPISDEVFAAEVGRAGWQVTHFSAGVAAVGQSFGQVQIGYVAGLAVDHASDAVYVADSSNSVIERFTRFEGPTVATTTGVSIDQTSATLHGTVDPSGVSSTYHFEYGLDTGYGARTAESEPVTGSGPVPATAIAAGLSPEPNTTYHFRIVGSNASGSIVGDDQTFTTPPAPPLLDGSPAFVSSVKTTGATLNATLNPNGSDTTYHFEYGAAGPCDANPCASTSDVGAGAGRSDQPVAAALSGLMAGTAYHYRLVADNGAGGVQHGVDATFATAPATPATASNITLYGADLHAAINPHGAPTTYHFEYGATTAYGKTTPETDGGSTSGDKDVSHAVSGLFAATTYHFRIVATSNGQTTTSDDATFTTDALPLAVLAYPTAISASEATLAGMIDTHDSPGSYSFHVASLDSPYTTTTTAQPTPSGNGMQPVTARLTGLPAGETFWAVLSVTSNQATASDSIVFSTPQLTRRANRPAPNIRCTTPTLNPYQRHPQPGHTITLTGRDLGTGGTATLNGKPISPRHWTPSRVTVRIPRRATGTQALTIDCGQRSNTIAIKITPTNKFTITETKTKTNTAILSVRLPGPGKVRTTSRHTNPKTIRIAKAGAATIKIKLTNTATTTLANTGKLKTTIHIRYTPNHGQPNTNPTTLTYKRKARRDDF